MNEKGTLIIVLVVLVTFIGVMIYQETTFEDRVLQKALDKNYNGIVVKKYIDYENHAVPKVILRTEKETIMFKRIYDQLKIGDSISKQQGDLKVYIYKKDRTIVFDTTNY